MKASLVKARAVLAAKNAERRACPEHMERQRATAAAAQKRWYSTRPEAQRQEMNARKRLAKATRLYVRLGVLGLTTPRLTPKAPKVARPRKVLTEAERALRRRLKNQRKWAKRKGAKGKVRPADIEWLRSAQKGRCFYCCEKFGKDGFHIDHFVALARGGSNDRENLRLACPDCNIAKSDKPAAQFMGMLIL